MIADSEILTYIFLGFVAFLFVMIFWNVLGGPRKRRGRRWGGGSGVAGTGGETMVGRGDRHNGADDGGSDGGGGDGGGGD